MIRHQLEPWQELSGFLHDVEIKDDIVIITISRRSTLKYLRRSDEGKNLLKHLSKKKIGKYVGILQTDNDLRVYCQDEAPKFDKSTPFWIWYCKKYGYVED